MARFFLILFFSTTIFFILFAFPKESINAVKNSVSDFLSIVFPSLFPFMLASTILIKTGILKKAASVFKKPSKILFGCGSDFVYVFLCALISGYPTGAKLSCDLYANKNINAGECKKMINSTSLCGPLFVSGVVCIGVLGSEDLFPYLYIPHVLSAIITGILLKNTHKGNKISISAPDSYYKNDIAQCIADSFSSCFKTLSIVFGYMILFTMITNAIFMPIEDSFLKSVSTGMLELSSGILSLKNADISFFAKIAAAEFIITFGGASVLMQTYSIMSQNKIKNTYFIYAKLIQTAAAVLICIFLISISGTNGVYAAIPV